MRRLVTLAVVVASALVAPSCAARNNDEATHGEPASSNIRVLAEVQSIGLGAAIERAVALVPGDALEAEMEYGRAGSRREPVVSVAVLTQDGTLHDVTVRAADGSIVSDRVETDAAEVREMTALRAKLPAGHLPLRKLLHGSGASGAGRLLSVEFDEKTGGGFVRGVRDGRFVQVDLDAMNGAAKGKASAVADEEEDEEHEDGDDEDDEDDGPAGRYEFKMNR